MNRTTALLAATVVAVAIAPTAGAQAPSAKNFVAHLPGEEEVPTRETLGVGQAVFQYDATADVLRYRLIVSNIDNVVASHIHLGVFGVNGPVVAFLAGNFQPGGGRTDGVLAEGSIASGDLVGPLVGQDLSVLIEAMRTGGAYVNVHTNDGVAPTNTGPGDFPGGEVRGQIRAAGGTP